MPQICKALPRLQIIPQIFWHQRDGSQSLYRHGIQEADKSGPKQEYIIGKEGGRFIIFWVPNNNVFLSNSEDNGFVSIIVDLTQDMLQGNNNYPRTVTREYDMLTRFEMASPRSYHTKRPGDKCNKENCGGRGGRDQTFIQHTAPLGTDFIPGINSRISYIIKCFNFEKGKHCDNQFPELTQDRTPNNSGKIWHKSAGVLHKVVVVVQWATTGSYWKCVPLSAVPKTTQLSQTSLWDHWNNTSAFIVMDVTWPTRWGALWTSSLWAFM